MMLGGDLGRQLSELIGAVGLYLGDLQSGHESDKDRLRRAMHRAMRSEAFTRYMETSLESRTDD